MLFAELRFETVDSSLILAYMCQKVGIGNRHTELFDAIKMSEIFAK